MLAVFQQPELRGMSARARPRVTLRMVFVLFAELFYFSTYPVLQNTEDAATEPTPQSYKSAEGRNRGLW